MAWVWISFLLMICAGRAHGSEACRQAIALLEEHRHDVAAKQPEKALTRSEYLDSLRAKVSHGHPESGLELLVRDDSFVELAFMLRLAYRDLNRARPDDSAIYRRALGRTRAKLLARFDEISFRLPLPKEVRGEAEQAQYEADFELERSAKLADIDGRIEAMRRRGRGGLVYRAFLRVLALRRLFQRETR
jgi:hypothetical protein